MNLARKRTAAAFVSMTLTWMTVHADDLEPRKSSADWSKAVKEINWKEIESSVSKTELGATKDLGHNGGNAFKDVPKQGAILIGFDFIMTPFKKSPSVVRGIAPIYLTQNGEMAGEIHGAEKGKKKTAVPLVAKPGYAVGKVTGQFDGVAMRRIKVRFEKIVGSHLDHKDAYESAWMGIYDRSLVSEETIDTLGNIPVGIAGCSGWGLGGLQVIFQAP